MTNKIFLVWYEDKPGKFNGFALADTGEILAFATGNTSDLVLASLDLQNYRYDKQYPGGYEKVYFEEAEAQKDLEYQAAYNRNHI